MKEDNSVLLSRITETDLKLCDSPEWLIPEISRRIGYPSDDIPEKIRLRIREIIIKGLHEVRVQFLIRTTPVIGWQDGLIKGKSLRIESSKWSWLLDKMVSPQFLCCFILTLGKGIDLQNKSLREKSLFDSFVHDVFGSVMVENAADQIESRIVAELKPEEIECSRRFSPGYCDWVLKSGQLAMSRFLEPNQIGIRCMPSGVMAPAKTISAVILAAESVPWHVPCVFCKEIKCRHRRTC